jgi:PEP-CTERM motif
MKESTMNRKVLLRTAIALGAVLLVLDLNPGRALADVIVNISVNTSSLGSSGSSEVFFNLTGTGANTATISAISLGGGTAGAVDTVISAGGFAPSSNLGSTISLNDTTAFLNVFAQSFTAGTSLSFLLDLTTNVVTPTPDQFSFYILDPTGSPIVTSDPTGFDNLATINLDSPSPAPNVYSSLVTVTPAAVTPEPGTLTLLVLGLAGTVPMFRRRSRPGAGR